MVGLGSYRLYIILERTVVKHDCSTCPLYYLASTNFFFFFMAFGYKKLEH
ncbi:hypothetical protein HanIR_Chr13g0669321 [Helianthus annuus]|nr:hypothetical protein HanIR_Chr13g0669321 [Helianthus annuus]